MNAPVGGPDVFKDWKNDGIIGVSTKINALRVSVDTGEGGHLTSVKVLNVEYVTIIVLDNPDTAVTSAPAGLANSATAKFSFIASRSSLTFQCKLDNGDYSSCTSPREYQNLADDDHTFCVAATDAAGNTDPEPACYTWTVDTTPPDTTISDTGKPSNPSNSSSAGFAFTSSETGSTFECRLDGGGWISCTSSRNYSGLSDGSHTFDVRATDAAGNMDQTPASFTWVIDTTIPPVLDTIAPTNTTGTNFISSGASATNSTSVTLSVSATDNVGVTGYYVSEDPTAPAASTSGWTPITSTTSYSASVPFTLSAGDGTKKVYVWFKDVAGNVSGLANDTIILDTTPPAFLSSIPANGAMNVPVTNRTISFTFNEAMGPGYSVTWTGDSGGNTSTSWSSDKKTISFTFDTDLPVNTTISWVLNPSAYLPNFRDLAGNPLLSDTNSGSFTTAAAVDITPPETTITGQPSDPSSSNAACFDFTSSEAGSTFECQLDGGAWESCSSPKCYSGLTDGSHTFTVRATDVAANTDPTPASYTWTVAGDTISPVNTTGGEFINGGAAEANSATVTLTVSATDNVGVTAYCALDNDTGTEPSAPASNKGCWVSVSSNPDYSANVLHTFTNNYSSGTTVYVYVWFKDAAGNVSGGASDNIIFVSVIYLWDFEQGWGNWSTDNGVWQVGTPTPGVGPGGCLGDSSTQCAGTELTGNYGADTDSRLVSPTIQLPEVTGLEEVHLRFQNWFSYASYDSGQVQAQVWNPETSTWGAWVNVGTAVVNTSSWSLKGDVDLTAYAGQTVRIAFYHIANCGGYGDCSVSTGWYIDDIQVLKY